MYIKTKIILLSEQINNEKFYFREGFGLYSVNFNDPQKTRTPKSSLSYYRAIIKNKMLPDRLRLN